ncbi:MAG: hypothetical protein WC916_05975 [Candidatus Woesearchaeota archaeon]
MRIQEHLFQGFFGVKKKKDSLKYHKQKENTLLEIDKQLDEAIESHQKKASNHRKKVLSYTRFIQKHDEESWKPLKEEILKLKGAFDEDELANNQERRKISKIVSEIKTIQKEDEDSELKNTEREMADGLHELESLLEEIGTIWEEQLKIADMETQTILSTSTIQERLNTILQEENRITSREEHILKEVDLKLGILLRKTTLKLRDLEKTKDMNIEYREIKHIR